MAIEIDEPVIDHNHNNDGAAAGAAAPASKRLRWATMRRKGSTSTRKRTSIMDRLHKNSHDEKKRDSGGTDPTASNLGDIRETPEGNADDPDGDDDHGGDEGEANEPRKVYFNTPLPPEALDENGNPSSYFVRNKVRTAKYTPISFVPKNLWYQFQNIANIYFFILIILTIFPIFGGYNPGLSAVPLIVIVFITAVKDAIEDYRRTMLDNELNNSPVHRLVEWQNVNTNDHDVSLWRRIKKATTRSIVSSWRLILRVMSKDEKEPGGKTYAQRALDESRPSLETTASRRASAYSTYSRRTSFASAREDIQMTPVTSPLPRPDENGMDLKPKDGALGNDENLHRPAVPKIGNLVNRDLPAGKARFQKDYWKNVNVGDFVRIYNDDQLPADVVIVASSDPEGACYVETKNLDGETNLKLRHALRSGKSIRHARDCERAKFVIESEAPQPNLYQYSAIAQWTQFDPAKPDSEGEEMAEPISINNLLLRGCNLRNTEWVLAVVVFTGTDTKIMINSGITPSKRSRIARELNWNVIYNFIILLIMCITSGIVEGFAFGDPNSSIDWFEYGSIGGTPALNGFITFWAALILFQNMIPISLYITLEIIRTAQAYFIYSDLYMYYEKLDYPCTPKSWNISDDLGQIEYIFSDKTGTLTQNLMEFKKATVNGIPYGEAYTEAQAGMQRRQGIDVEAESARATEEIAYARVKMLEETRKLHDNPYLHDEDLTFIAPDFITDLGGESGEEQKDANMQFMLALSLCHTVISETIPGDPPRIEFKAQSPDEAALVSTARDVGFTVIGSSTEGIELNIMGKRQHFAVLNTLEFNSTRKRMSAIIRMPDGKIILFSKGADSIIYSRLRKGEQAEMRKTTADHLEMFAREGLRTLCIAQRVLTEEEYQKWNKEHVIAAGAVRNREEKLEEVADQIERELTLLGGTAIEDRLQSGVPDTIALLAEAGIKLWVLTGDKVETAINIGFSCNLLNNDMELIVFKIQDESPATAEAELDKHLAIFGLTGSNADLAAAKKNHEAPAPTHAVVIDGDSLKLVLDQSLRQKFLLLCKECKSVLCCRVSPAQKAAVVQMVKGGLDVMTLSIGDGANDVAMIQEADVGVGIAGEEGRQAVMSADYAIGQFRFLQRLVLVHGRWSYRRLGETIANFFYKNIVWTFVIFWYEIFTDFDMTYLYDYTYILLFNLAFTSLPVIFMGVLDQDVSDVVSLAVPQLYRRGIERKEWTQPKFWLYMFDGFYQSVICFFFAYLLFGPARSPSQSGQDVSEREHMGIFIAPSVIFVVNFYILMNTYRWDWLIVLLTIISTLLVFFWTGVYTSFTSAEIIYKGAAQVFGQPSYWALTCLTIIGCLLPRFSIKAIQKVYLPYDVDIIREKVQRGDFSYLDTSSIVMPKKPKTKKEKKLSSSWRKSKKAKSADSSSTTSSPMQKPSQANLSYDDEDRRPIYPPSVAQTATTHNARSNNGSDGTEYTRHRLSLEPTSTATGTAAAAAAAGSNVNSTNNSNYNNSRLSVDKPRPSFDRMRASMDRCRPSFEASNDFTSAALLTRLESSQSFTYSRARRADNIKDEQRQRQI